jgi:hypothetical protein
MNETIQQVIRDIEVIRRAIENAECGNPTPRAEPWELRTQVGLISFGIIFFIYDRLTFQSQVLLSSSDSESLRYVGVATVAILLLMLAAIVHQLVRLAARQNKIEVDSFVERHFVYLRNSSFFFDLGIKFLIFTLVIFAKQPQLVAPLASLYVADLLFQGRLFVLSLPASMALGTICCLTAIAQFFLGDAQLAWPLGLFVASATCSAIYLNTLRSTKKIAA